MEWKHVTLYPSEWTVMDCLWKRAPQTLMEIVRALEGTTDWSASTIKTLVGRMTAKGYLRCEQDKPRRYYPAVAREDAAYTEAETLLQRGYQGRLGMLVSSFVEREALSPSELDELREILRKAEEKK